MRPWETLDDIVRDHYESENSLLPVKLCPSSALAPVAFFSTVFALAALLCLHRKISQEPCMRTVVLSIWMTFLNMSNAIFIIGDSYAIARFFGLDVVYSGILIGSFFIGSSAGSAIVWLIFKFQPGHWREGVNLLLSIPAGLALLGGLLCTMPLIESPFHISSHLASGMLLVGRFLTGLNHGFVSQVFQVACPALLKDVELGWYWQAVVLAVAGGYGMAPSIAGGAELLASCPLHTRPLQKSGLLTCLSSLSLVALAAMLPKLPALLPGDISETADGEATKIANDGSNQDFRSSRAQLLAGLTFMEAVRALLSGGIEAAMVYLLETKFGWSQSQIGWAVTASYCSIFPCNALFHVVEMHFSMKTLMRTTSALVALASLLFFDVSNKSHGLAESSMLILSGVLGLPFLYIGSGLCWSMISMNATEQGSALDMNNMSFFGVLACDLIGRLLGPVWSRSVIVHGQNSYAAQQIAAVAAWSLIFEVAVVRNMD